MLKRIATLGNDEKAEKTVEKTVKKLDVQLTPVGESTKIPPLSDGFLHYWPVKDAVSFAVQHADNSVALLMLLAEAVDCRESFKPKSSQRVVDHATRFAKAVKLDDDQRILLERGALLRDIGKLKIPNEVLLKNGLLTYDEWKLIQEHTNIGADLVKDIPGLAPLEDIIRCHHECFDGDGYPNKLEGDNIPYLARIVKIIDVYCAMTSPRAYRTGVASQEDALGHIKNEQGKHFDPDLVAVFLEKKIGGTAVESH
jgi:HD-GYP domain-containing protein (c-di-GMP phosphodiesterase class II)